MKYNDLEKTKDLFDISDAEVPSPIEDIDREGVSKENLTDDLTFGLGGDDAVPPQKEEIPESSSDTKKGKKEKEKKPKRSLKEKWLGLSKKKKNIIIICSVLILLLIIGIVLFFVLRKEPVDPVPEPEEPEVIVEKDNYIYRDGVLVFLNSDDEEIGTYECTNQNEDLCFVPTYSEEDEFDGPRNVYQDESIVERPSAIYQNKYVFVYDNESEEDGNLVLYNIESGEQEGTYDLIKGFSDSDFVIVRNTNNRYGALEFSSDGVEEVFEFSYDYLGRLSSDSHVVVRTNDRYYIYDVNGKNLSQGLRYEVMSYNDEYIVAYNNGYYVYSYDGDLIYDDSYDYIELLDDYAVLIDRGLLYIRDYQNNKYNEVGIELESELYNPLHVYSEDKKLIEERRAYEVTINDDIIDVTYTIDNRDRTETIDIEDGKMSANYSYINYFDGILYFYQDEEETDLLGTYECSNANSSDLTNCTIATDTFYSKNEVEEDKSSSVGWIPIYNDRFVFILDTIDLNNPTIVLYDLEQNKALARYSSVDSGAYTGKKEVSFVDTDATYVMAQVKSDGDYGLVRISDNVSGTIAFDYDSIEKIGDYYEVGTSSGTYQLFSNVGQAITGTYGYRIVDYVATYLKVADHDTYYVYDFEGNRLREEDGAYHYVDLQNNYYVVIDSSNKLNIHKYTDPEFALSEAIDVGTENYEGAYTVSEVNGGFRITITSTNMTYTFDSNGLIQVSG